MFLYLTKTPVKTPILQFFIKTQPTVALKKHGLNLQQPNWFFASNSECECFIRGSRHRETDESMRPQADCFHCFKVSETPDETQSTSF